MHFNRDREASCSGVWDCKWVFEMSCNLPSRQTQVSASWMCQDLPRGRRSCRPTYHVTSWQWVFTEV